MQNAPCPRQEIDQCSLSRHYCVLPSKGCLVLCTRSYLCVVCCSGAATANDSQEQAGNRRQHTAYHTTSVYMWFHFDGRNLLDLLALAGTFSTRVQLEHTLRFLQQQFVVAELVYCLGLIRPLSYDRPETLVRGHYSRVDSTAIIAAGRRRE